MNYFADMCIIMYSIWILGLFVFWPHFMPTRYFINRFNNSSVNLRGKISAARLSLYMYLEIVSQDRTGAIFLDTKSTLLGQIVPM